MKYIVFGLFFTSIICADFDLEKMYVNAFNIATDLEKKSELRDGAHALSDLWELTMNYNFETFRDEEIEWNRKNISKLKSGSAMILNDQLFLFLSARGLGNKTLVFLNLEKFTVEIFSKEKIKDNALVIHCRNISNEESEQVVVSFQTDNIKYEFEGEAIEFKGTFEEDILNSPPVFSHNYLLAIVANQKLTKLSIITTNKSKSQQFFSDETESGTVCSSFDKNDGTISMVGKITASVSEAPILLFDILIAKIDD
ncbi:hypothetical protein [Candidatus Uabimicrobium sp. HlEnr_7]|uniref:hypothetical protein n=1 Tax=Candidatus Uabimicrobium helgolandensis TaxID=3095367 RepID=UPI0035572941